MNQRNSIFHMANLGSEISRTLSWREKGDLNQMKNSINRALVIIDKIFKENESNGGVKEALILREILVDLLENNLDNYNINPDNLRDYFNPFALKVMST